MLSVRDVLVSEWIDVLLGQPKVNDIHYALVGSSKASEKEVLWLHVTIDQVLTVDILQSSYLEGCVCVCECVCMRACVCECV